MYNTNNPKIYLNKIREDWIVDRFKQEFYNFNTKRTTKFITQSDTIWIIAPWLWKNIPKKQLKRKKVICTIHHIDESKFGFTELEEFKQRDQFVDLYHVTSKITFQKLSSVTNKKIVILPFWINENIFFSMKNTQNLRDKYNLDINQFLVGSFQRDSEGSNLLMPKLSKGPDRFVEIVDYLNSKYPNLTVVLTGWRRDYIINELTTRNIKFRYFEKIDTVSSNELYNCLDLYIVASRVEGGPMSILEAGITRTPIISTDVGIASKILSDESIFNMNNYKNAKPNVEYAYSNSKKFTQENINSQYLQMIDSVHEN